MADDISDTLVERQHAGASEGVVNVVAFFPVLHNTGVLENSEMLGYGRCVCTDHFGKLAHTVILLTEFIHNEQPGRMRHRLNNLSHFVIFNFIEFTHNLIPFWQNCQIDILCQGENWGDRIN